MKSFFVNFCHCLATTPSNNVARLLAFILHTDFLIFLAIFGINGIISQTDFFLLRAGMLRAGFGITAAVRRGVRTTVGRSSVAFTSSARAIHPSTPGTCAVRSVEDLLCDAANDSQCWKEKYAMLKSKYDVLDT